ncbi:MAG: reverse transcriptase family protein [Bacteroidota bacterium]
MRQHKTYPLRLSPLYGLQNKRKLCSLLGVELDTLKRLEDDSCYNVFETRSSLGKGRIIEEPVGVRKRIHLRLFKLLQRIELPRFLYSGRAGISYVDNAMPHVKNQFVLKVDIQSFYQSSRAEFIFRFFHYELRMSEDVAWLITNVLTYNGHIPTGSHVSQVIAYWAYSRVFETLSRLALSNGMEFSLYVDDITFSSPHVILRTFHLKVSNLLKTVELRLKNSKLKYKEAGEFKTVTGCVISPSGDLVVPNKLRKKIIDDLKQIEKSHRSDTQSIQRAIGRILAAQQLERSFMDESLRKLRMLRKEESPGTEIQTSNS